MNFKKWMKINARNIIFFVLLSLFGFHCTLYILSFLFAFVCVWVSIRDVARGTKLGAASHPKCWHGPSQSTSNPPRHPLFPVHNCRRGPEDTYLPQHLPTYLTASLDRQTDRPSHELRSCPHRGTHSVSRFWGVGSRLNVVQLRGWKYDWMNVCKDCDKGHS